MRESGENYLETFLILKARNGSVRSVDVASELGYTKASISRAISTLREQGYVTMAEDGELEFTQLGQETAEAVYERHRYLTKFLSMSLGVDEETASRDACRIEHVISQDVFDAVKAYVEGTS